MAGFVRCGDCELFDQNSPVVLGNGPQPDPDRGLCRAKLPQVAMVMTQQGPSLITFQPEMAKTGGCGEGEQKASVPMAAIQR